MAKRDGEFLKARSGVAHPFSRIQLGQFESTPFVTQSCEVTIIY